MATGFEIHRRRNPGTGQYWRSVYTPDVPASREGHVTPSDRHGRWPHRSRGRSCCGSTGRRCSGCRPAGCHRLHAAPRPPSRGHRRRAARSAELPGGHRPHGGPRLGGARAADRPRAARGPVLHDAAGARVRRRRTAPVPRARSGPGTEPALATAAGNPAAGS